MGLSLAGEVLVREGREKMDMVALEVVGTADKVDEAPTMEVLPGLTTLVGLGVYLAVNGGGANGFQTAADIEVVAEAVGEAIENLVSSKEISYSQHQLVVRTVGMNYFPGRWKWRPWRKAYL